MHRPSDAQQLYPVYTIKQTSSKHQAAGLMEPNRFTQM